MAAGRALDIPQQPDPAWGSGSRAAAAAAAAAAADAGRPPTAPGPTHTHPLHATTAPAPAAAADGAATALGDREGSVHRRSTISIHADGSGHGGRHYFAALASMGQDAGAGSTATRQQRWERAMEQADGLEQDSMQDHAPLPLSTPPPPPAEQAPAGGAAAAPHQAIWVVEDGSSIRPSSSSTPPAGMQDGSAKGSATGGGGAGGGSGGGGGGGGAGRKDAFAGAVFKVEEASEREYQDWGTYFSTLPKKLKGGLDTPLPRPTLRNLFWSWLGAFLGILAVCALNQWASPEIDIAFLVGSFGASAVLVFAVLESKMSQPRNFLGGQILSAVVGITTRVVIHQTWIAGPVGMSLALVLMMLTSTTHPPGGATALIAATLPTLPKWHGYSFLVTVAVGSLVMQLIALVVNNLDPRRRYPSYWF